MKSKKSLFWPLFTLIWAIPMPGRAQFTYTFYPTYNIVRGTSGNILNITLLVAKVPASKAAGTIIGYVSEKDAVSAQQIQYALVLASGSSENVWVDVNHAGSGLLMGSGVRVEDALENKL